MTTRKLLPLTVFNTEIVQKPLNGLLTNLNREVERSLKQSIETHNAEAERHWSLLFMMLRLATSSYESVCFLLVSAQNDPKVLSRRALVIPPNQSANYGYPVLPDLHDGRFSSPVARV